MIPTFVKQMPGYRRLRRALQKRLAPLAADQFSRYSPSGHFYSPLPDMEYVDRNRARLFDRQVTAVPGIDIRVGEQLALLRDLSAFSAELPFTAEKADGLRYYFENPFFTYGDGVVLYSILRHYRPGRVIEVGSGFSSALILDTNDLFLSGSAQLTFIEPHPERLFSVMNAGDRARHEVIVAPVQDVPLAVFESCQANDILFIDSSHVAKAGSVSSIS